ncbi:hypothetical protein [Actinokineospora diospyrosa]|nr:hypothetical protein [Actinokineospora diospyrosa]
MAHLGIDTDQLAARSRVSLKTVQELVHNTTQRNRHALTLARLSRALELDPGHLRHLASTPIEAAITIELGKADLSPDLRTLFVTMLAKLNTELDQIRADYTTLKHQAAESAHPPKNEAAPADLDAAAP